MAGFTLIELLLVLLVIGTLAGIAMLMMPTFIQLGETFQSHSADREGELRDDTAHLEAGFGSVDGEATPAAVDSLTLEARDGDDAVTEARVGDELTLRVEVTGDEGQPVEGASIRLEDAEGQRFADDERRTDSAGRLELDYTQPAGTDQLTACTSSLGAEPASCSETDGPAATVEVVWVPPVDSLTLHALDGDEVVEEARVGEVLTLRVEAADHQGESIDNVSVLVEDADGQEKFQGQTDADGRLEFDYTHPAGIDDLTACTNSFGEEPDSCSSADGPTAGIEVAWLPAPGPSLVRRALPEDEAVVVIWDEAVLATGSASDVVWYDDESDCEDGTGGVPATDVAMFDATTMRVVVDYDVDGWVRVRDGTVESLSGVHNLDSDCLGLETPVAASPLGVNSAEQAHEDGSGDELVVRFTRPVHPDDGAADPAGYELYQGESCDGGLIAQGASRLSFGAGVVRVGFDQSWSAEESFSLLVTDETEIDADGRRLSAGLCHSVDPAPTEPESLSLVEATAPHTLVDGSYVVLEWNRPVRVGLDSDLESYELYDDEASCIAVAGSMTPTARAQVDGPRVRLRFGAAWPPDESRWLAASPGVAQDAFGEPSDEIICTEVETP